MTYVYSAAAVGVCHLMRWAVMWKLYVCTCAWRELRHSVHWIKSCCNGDRCTVKQGNLNVLCSSVTLGLLLDTVQWYVNEFLSPCSCFSELNKVMHETSCAHVVCAHPQQSVTVTEYCLQTSWWMPGAKCLHPTASTRGQTHSWVAQPWCPCMHTISRHRGVFEKSNTRLKMQIRHTKGR